MPLLRNPGIEKRIESFRTSIKCYKTHTAPELVIFRKPGFSEFKFDLPPMDLSKIALEAILIQLLHSADDKIGTKKEKIIIATGAIS